MRVFETHDEKGRDYFFAVHNDRFTLGHIVMPNGEMEFWEFRIEGSIKYTTKFIPSIVQRAFIDYLKCHTKYIFEDVEENTINEEDDHGNKF